MPTPHPFTRPYSVLELSNGCTIAVKQRAWLGGFKIRAYAPRDIDPRQIKTVFSNCRRGLLGGWIIANPSTLETTVDKILQIESSDIDNHSGLRRLRLPLKSYGGSQPSGI